MRERLSTQKRATRFEPDTKAVVEVRCDYGRVLMDPEAPYDSEEQFAATLGGRGSKSRSPRFLPDTEEQKQGTVSADSRDAVRKQAVADDGTALEESSVFEKKTSAVLLQDSGADILGNDAELLTTASGNSSVASSSAESHRSGNTPGADTFWKDEVAARLNCYRARRKPRPPKYPSLRLKFDSPERRPATEPTVNFTEVPNASRESVAREATAAETGFEPETAIGVSNTICSAPSAPIETGRIIEFPRSHSDLSYSAPVSTNQLADPVFDTPRIVEVPDMEPPAPALGGIILEAEEREPERRPGFEIPLRSAPMRRRLAATLCDAGLVSGACLLFGYISFRITGTLPLWKEMATLGIGLFGFFWATYLYLLLTYAGTTPGLSLAQLQLRRFDGSPVNRRTRRWRVIASVLSGLS
ncbi:MAG TPA: RDD family protein, partial [Terriglobales bacterium]|nr:RDD family protein [Terriglobales bacterium]